jgi:hypothetical protein
MDSEEILKNAITPIGAKSIAADMNLSASLIYKWCQSKDYNTGAADNPLDRLAILYDLTKDDNIIRWLCERADGYFVKNIHANTIESKTLFEVTQKILSEFSELLSAISKSSQDGNISKRESENIRSEWEDLKSIAENFVSSCEKGVFKTKKDL